MTRNNDMNGHLNRLLNNCSQKSPNSAYAFEISNGEINARIRDLVVYVGLS